jgi:DNA repair protein RecN (Recombination protein N)
VLRELRVENLLLIERAELRLAPGLNVLTGETGAGKTVLAHAFDLLLGGRARPGIVRPGASEAYVEGVFDLDDDLRAALGERIGADCEELVLARRVGADGRTRALLGGRAATVADLRDVGASLITFYGQHEHRKLTLAGAQLEILDGLCDAGHAGRLRSCGAAYERVGVLRERTHELAELAAQRDRELDLLEYELAEIEELAPDQAEHERLLAARERLRRLDSLRAAAGAAAHALDPDLADGAGPAPHGCAAVAQALDGLRALTGVDAELDAIAQRLGSLLIEMDDLAGELRRYCSGDDDLADAHGPGGRAPTLEELEERLAVIERLARKHGGSVAAVLEFADGARARRAELAGADEALERTSAELQRAEREVSEHVTALRRARTKAAGSFARAVPVELAELAMADASFAVELSERPAGPVGADAVEFVIAPNPGVPAAPVREIASGGELSRVMLAIMSVAGGAATGGTLVFDEVDAGVGGHTARAVGARLRALAATRQVLCITHLPQIASLGERHFAIVKDTSAEPTRTSVVELREPEVVSELVRMLGADSDDAGARRHARELRRAA